jgi:hypothetical protein
MRMARVRDFSSGAHESLIGAGEDARVNSTSLSRTILALLLVTVVIGGVALGRAVMGVVSGTPAPSATATPTPTPTPATLPAADVEGEDFARLPRYPGSLRTEYRIIVDEGYRLTTTEYLVDADVDAVRTFYRNVIAEHGWDRADIGYEDGEWIYVLVDGQVEALIEIEDANGLTEIDLQVSEPIAGPTPEPTPEPTPTPAPDATRAPTPQPVPTPSDDDDDGDDVDDSGGGDGDDTFDDD